MFAKKNKQKGIGKVVVGDNIPESMKAMIEHFKNVGQLQLFEKDLSIGPFIAPDKRRYKSA